MATTKIWPVSSDLGYTIRYIVNPQKTQDGKLVSGLNLSADAHDSKGMYQDMLCTKKRFGKTGGRLGYHMEQPFKPGETTPELAHQIGLEFARQLFGDDFQVVVSTHVDKEHIHNHFIVNSVSFVDGHKYHEPNKEYYNRIRNLSDQLCKKYSLSVIEQPKQGRYKSYPEQHHEEQPAHPTVHNLIYEDIDRAIAFSKNLDEFYQTLRDMGYRVKRDGKYPAIAPEGRKFFRLYKFAKGYTEEDIQTRICQRLTKRSPEKTGTGSGFSAEARLGQVGLATTYYGGWRSEREYYRTAARFQRYFLRRYYRGTLWQVYVQYRYVLRAVQRERYPNYPSVDLRRELRKLNRYSQQAVILAKNRIDTVEQLQQHIDDVDHQVHIINKEKWYLKRDVSKADPGEKEVLEQRIIELEQAAKPLTREKFLCRDILKKSSQVEYQVGREKEEAARDYFKERGRSI